MKRNNKLCPLNKILSYYSKVSEQFDLLDDALCDCDWYLFPMKMQQMFIIVMAGTQQPTIVQGFGNVLCTRETFKKVRDYFSVFFLVRISEISSFSNHFSSSSDNKGWFLIFHDIPPNGWIKMVQKLFILKESYSCTQ